MEFTAEFALAMVPLLIAADPAMVVTMYLGLTEGCEERLRRTVLRQALLTALLIGVGFMFLGPAIFKFLGIDTADFRIGGGLILLVLSLADLVTGDRAARRRDEFAGIVPLGTPLIVGPAVLTALTVIVAQHGYAVAATAFLSTLAVIALLLTFACHIDRAIGTGGLRAASKVISILLAAIAVSFIRAGILEIVDMAAARR